jgi:hypothetical protein
MRALDRTPRFSRDSSADDVRQRLRELPGEEHPPYDFTEFQRRSRERYSTQGSAIRWQHAAAAAGITVLVASMAIWGRADHHRAGMDQSGITTAPITAPTNTADRDARPAVAPLGDGVAPDLSDGELSNGSSVDEFNAKVRQARAAAASRAAKEAVAHQFAALARTQGSQHWLDTQPSEPAVVRVGPRLVVASLEDRIAWVDDALTDAQFTNASAARMRTLERERAQLVKSLAQVRYAETLVAQTP